MSLKFGKRSKHLTGHSASIEIYNGIAPVSLRQHGFLVFSVRLAYSSRFNALLQWCPHNQILQAIPAPLISAPMWVVWVMVIVMCSDLAGWHEVARDVSRRGPRPSIHLEARRHHLCLPCHRRPTVVRFLASSRPKRAITSKIKHAIKLKTSPARLAQLLHNCCSPR